MGNGSMMEGSAYDYYIDTDNGTQTISDTVTTSVDDFELIDTHTVSGSWSYVNDTDGTVEAWSDAGVNSATMTAEGVDSSSGDSFTFVDTESTFDDFVVTRFIPGEWSGTAETTQSLTDTTAGSEWTVAGGSESFSFNLSSTTETDYSAGGYVTYWVTQAIAPGETVTYETSSAYGGSCSVQRG